MALKVSAYSTQATALTAGDLFDLTKLISTGPNVYESQKADINLLEGWNLFGQDFTMPAPRLHNLGNNQFSLTNGRVLFKGSDDIGTDLFTLEDLSGNDILRVQNNGDLFTQKSLSFDLDNNKLTFDVGTVASGTNPNIGLRIDGSNIFYGGGLNSSPLLQVDSDLGNVLNVNSGGYLISTSDYTSSIALFEKRGTNLGLSLASNKQAMGVPLIQHKPLLTSGSSQMIQQFVSSTLVDFQLINADGATGDNPNIKHWLRFGDAISQAAFFRTGFSGRGFIVGAQFKLASEDISLQGSTLIKGEGTTTGTTLALYDNDTTPALTWEWLDNGNMNINQAVEVNTSNTFNFKNGSKEVGVSSWNVHAYWGINNGSTTWDLISANASSIFNANEFGIANGSIIPVRIYNGSSVALGNVPKSSLNTAYSVQTAGNTLIGGDLYATDGTNTVELDFNNYPKVKISAPSNEWWMIEGDGTGSVFDNGDLYIYDSTNARKMLQFKANGTINAPNLPTSSAGLSAGDIWNDGGTLKIV